MSGELGALLWSDLWRAWLVLAGIGLIWLLGSCVMLWRAFWRGR